MTHNEILEYLIWYGKNSTNCECPDTKTDTLCDELVNVIHHMHDDGDEDLESLLEAIKSKGKSGMSHADISNILANYYDLNPFSRQEIENFLDCLEPRAVDLDGKDFIPNFFKSYTQTELNEHWKGLILLQSEKGFVCCDCKDGFHPLLGENLEEFYTIQYIPKIKG
ncbi:MAG: hypothetical protein RLZZ292_1949 [Bacteroidota bacterium]|jgi:hypothetical protein